jgi:hypothetical protein
MFTEEEKEERRKDPKYIGYHIANHPDFVTRIDDTAFCTLCLVKWDS